MPGKIFGILQNIKWNSYIFGLATGIAITLVMSISIGLVISPHVSDSQSGSDVNIKTSCQGSSVQQNTPVDGHWSDWMEVGSCSVTCGEVGVIALVRECSNPYPQYGGNKCEGRHFGFGICSDIPKCEKENIALGKETMQSSSRNNAQDKWGSYLAVDGNRAAGYMPDGYMCTHSKDREIQPWWVVDLGKKCVIDNVVIYGRTDCCEDRLSNFDIDLILPEVGLQRSGTWSDVQHCHYQRLPFTGSGLNVTCKQVTIGRYLRIKLRGRDSLTLCEVKVYGRAVLDETTVRRLDALDLHHEVKYKGSIFQIFNVTDNRECNETCNSLSGCAAFKISAEHRCVLLFNGTNTG